MCRSFLVFSILLLSALFIISAKQQEGPYLPDLQADESLRSSHFLPGPAAGDTYQYARWTPGVTYPDDETEVTLEVWTKGKVKSIQLFSGSVNYAFLNDDGIDGDKKSGDNIWTLGEFTRSYANFWYPGFYTTGYSVRIIRKDGKTEEPAMPSLGVAEKKNYKATKVMKNFYVTKYAAFLIDKRGKLLDGRIPLCKVTCGNGNQLVFKTFYKGFDDIFDFLAVMPVVTTYHPDDLSQRVPYCVPVRNSVRNIGVPIFNNTAQFGSKGKLKAIIYHSFGSGSIFDHEWGHNWGVRIGDAAGFSGSDNKYGSWTGWHYTSYSNIVGQMAQKPQLKLEKNGDGTYKVTKVFDQESGRPFAPLTLYQMGLIPSSKVPPVKILRNQKYPDYDRIPESEFDTYTIKEIMTANGGERIPAYPNTQKKFRMAFIIVSDRKFSQAEYDYFSSMAKYFGSKETGSHYMMPFYDVTEGRAKLNTRLPKVK